MNLTISISNHPITGVSRKVIVKDLRITGHYIIMEHFTYNYDSNGNIINDRNSNYIMQSRTTLDSYIDVSTGLHVEPINFENGEPVFEEGVTGISEFEYLKSIPKTFSEKTTVWGCIEDIVTLFIQNLDNAGKFD